MKEDAILIKGVQIRCDGCGHTSQVYGNRQYATTETRRLGWSSPKGNVTEGGYVDHCPPCANDRKENSQ